MTLSVEGPVTYTGKPLTPAVTVKDKDGKTIPASDYSTEYFYNTNAGQAVVTVTGKGGTSGFVGTVTTDFTIERASKDIKLVLKDKTVTLEANGTDCRVDPAEISGSDAAGLTNDDIAYFYYTDKGCTKEAETHNKAGTYYVRAETGSDVNHEPAVSNVAKLTVAPEKVDPEPVKPDVKTPVMDLPAVKIAKPKAAKKAITVKWKKPSKANLKKIKRIEIQCSTDSKFKKAVKTKLVSSSKTSAKIKGLKKGKRYYIRVRGYCETGGIKHYSKKWSSVKSVKTK